MRIVLFGAVAFVAFIIGFSATIPNSYQPNKANCEAAVKQAIKDEQYIVTYEDRLIARQKLEAACN